MTEEEFIRNNRAINGGMDLPREYLLELFHSISTNPITLFGVSNGVNPDLNHNIWANLIKWSHITEPFIQCDYKHILCREIFITISGLSIATICSIFEHTDDEALLQECIEGLISISRITKYSLEDILDELLSCFCKFTMLLNPYAAAEETIFTFTNEIKPRMAIFTTFMIANKFGESIRGAWRSIIDCLLKLKRLNLLPHSLLETDSCATKDNKDDNGRSHSKFESKSRVIFSSFQPGNGTRNMSGLVGRFSQFLELESNAESMLAVGTEMEKNAKLIQQCQIGSIFINSGRLSEDSLQHLIRALVFAAAGKGQKFSTPVEEDETVGFCWDLTLIITMKNLHRFESFWSHFHESLAVASQFPLFSPCPFAEKAMLALLRVAAKILSEPPRPQNRQLEEMMFKSINLTWKLDKEIVDMCIESIAEVTMTILNQHAESVQTTIGWKTLLHLLTLIGRRPENYDRGVETIISLLMESDRITKSNYIYCIESAFGFVALKISPLETSSRILNLMVESVKWIIQWQKSSFSDPGSSSSEEGLHNKGSECLFMRLTEALRKTTLVRREEIRNQAVEAVSRCFLTAADELDWTTETCASCFNLVIFAMVDDLHEKMIDYSRREGMNREMRSMEGTLTRALEKMTEVYLRFLDRLMIGPGFRTFWLGLLRRMDTCMKSRVGDELQENVPGLLKRMILEMMKKKVLVPSDDNDLWEVTNVQIQWIAPSLKELFL